MQWEMMVPVLLGLIGIIASLLRMHAELTKVMREGFHKVADSNDRHNADADRRAKKARKALKQILKENRKGFEAVASQLTEGFNGKPTPPRPAKSKRPIGPADAA